MNPDSFIPFYGNDFLQACEGQPDYVTVAYFRAIWHFWHHNHCAGLRDDSEFLRRLCRADKDSWPEIMEFVFDNDKQFTLNGDGLWIQTRAVSEWDKSKAKHEAAVARGKMGGFHAHKKKGKR